MYITAEMAIAARQRAQRMTARQRQEIIEHYECRQRERAILALERILRDDQIAEAASILVQSDR
jgi:hypothetical protein